MFELTFISPYTFVFFSISFEQTFGLLLLLWLATKIIFAMSVEPGNEDVMPEASGGAYPICGACASLVKSKSQFIRTNCGNTFHKSCLSKSEKIRSYCPICDSRLLSEPSNPNTSVVLTRSQAKTTSTQMTNNRPDNNRPIEDQPSGSAESANVNVPDNTVRLRPTELQEMVSSLVSAQQSHLLDSLTDRISRIVQNNIESFSRLSINRPTTSVAAQSSAQQASPTQMQTLPAVEERTFREMLGISVNNSQNNAHLNTSRSGQLASHSSPSTDLSSRPDKVLHIMSNWRIKFTGSSGGLSVENFIYRIESLTLQTLQGNFDLLCRNASSLFEGKAADWFWRYHRSVSFVSWSDLCRALRQQYSDSRSDVDIRELKRDRKQKPGELFDKFYDSVVELTDRLKEPLSSDMLVEILRRNLLPEIQHEILNLRITCLQELRDICRRREFFLQDIRRKHGSGFQKSTPIGRKVFELDELEAVGSTEPLATDNE